MPFESFWEELEHYDSLWGDPDYTWGPIRYHEWANERVEQPNLDVGCGDAHIRSSVYLEISVKALERCRQKGLGSLMRADARHLPFRDKAFNSVSMTELLEHLPDPFAAQEEARRVTRRRLVITVPVKGDHLDVSHKRDVDYQYYGFNPSEVRNIDNFWCVMECLSA